ncbi:1892_t:CDS:1, partial [Acaulospora colombiana]
MDSKLEENDLDIRAQARRVIEDIDAAQRDSPNVADLFNFYTRYNGLVDEAQQRKMIKVPDRFSVLPVELIHQILLQCCRDSTDDPLLLSSVSSRWFRLVCDFPDIWTKIMINTNEEQWEERLEVYARRSKDRLLDVTLCFPLSSEQVTTIINSHCLTRWRSLTVIDTRSDKEKGTWSFLLRLTEPQDLLQLFRFNNFPELRQVDIRVKSPYTREPCLWSGIFFNTPTLQSLSISPVLLSNLTINLIFIEFSALLVLLTENPGLVSIKLSSQRRLFPLVANHTAKIPLHHLQSLVSEDMVDVLSILQHIDCPNLQTLQLSCATDKLPPLMDHIVPLHHLKILKLKIGGPTENEFLPKSKFSRSPSNLHYLRIEYYVADVPPRHRMSSAISQIATFFPTVKIARIITDNNSTQWRHILGRFTDLEELIIEYDTRKVTYTEDKAAPLASRANIVLPKLQSLQIRGDAVHVILRSLNAPSLTFLSIKDTKSFDVHSHLSLSARFPAVHTLQFQALCPDSALKEIEQRPANKHALYPSSIEELVTMHDSCPLLEHMDLSR